MSILSNALIKAALCGVLIACAAGCTSIQIHRIDQTGPDLPIEPGDRVRIIEKGLGREHRLIVTDLREETIEGKLLASPEVEVGVRREDILQIEVKKFDGKKTALYTGLILLTLFAVTDALGDVFDDLADSFSGGGD